MDRNVTTHLELFKALEKAKPRVRKSLLETATCDLVRCLVEVAHNTLNGNVALTADEKKKLKKHRTSLRRLVVPGESAHKKRKLLVQQGGGFFFPALLAPIIAAIIGQFASK